MIYVMSDIHGHYNKFKKMLELIKFSNNDSLYILGDIVDRGTQNLEMIEYCMNTPNVHLIRGNHEEMLLKGYQQKNIYHDVWVGNGGQITEDQLNILGHLDFNILNKMQEYLENLPYYIEINLHNKNYLFVHASIPFIHKEKPFDKIPKEAFIWDRPYNSDKEMYSGYTVVLGHTPTSNFGCKDKIYYNKEMNFYNVDCGCGFYDVLGCLRLDDLKEFYIQGEKNVKK